MTILHAASATDFATKLREALAGCRDAVYDAVVGRQAAEGRVSG